MAILNFELAILNEVLALASPSPIQDPPPSFNLEALNVGTVQGGGTQLTGSLTPYRFNLPR